MMKDQGGIFDCLTRFGDLNCEHFFTKSICSPNQEARDCKVYTFILISFHAKQP